MSQSVIETSAERNRRGHADAEPVLAVRGLSKAYGELVAVDDVSFDIAPGEVVGLLGPNGAGKTTVIRVLSTMVAPTAGSFRVGGCDADQPAAVRRLIGVFPENSASPSGNSGRAEIEFHARLHGHDRDAARAVALELLQEVGLEYAANRRVGGYSRGMRQRLGIARSLIGDPSVIFLDEPTLGLDPAGRRMVLDIILETSQRRGCAVVVSTHLLDEVERVCGRVIILNGGRLIADGTVDELRLRSGLRSEILLQLDGDLPAATRALRALPEVGGVRADDGAPGGLAVSMPEAAGDAAPAVIDALLAVDGVHIRRFALEPARLEEVFLALTGGAS